MISLECRCDPGFSMIKSVKLQIGGTKIDKHYGRWMSIWSNLTRSENQDNNHKAMVGDGDATLAENTGELELFVPLQFFCCRNDGLALPLIALQYHDVELEIQLKAAKDLYTILKDDKNLSKKITILIHIQRIL